MKKLSFGDVLKDGGGSDDYYRAEDVENLLREITRRSDTTGQLLTIKCDVTDFIGPIIGYKRPAVRR